MEQSIILSSVKLHYITLIEQPRLQSLAWPTRSFTQKRYHFRYKRGAHILKAITPLRKNNPSAQERLTFAMYYIISPVNELL